MLEAFKKDVDARHKAGHDGGGGGYAMRHRAFSAISLGSLVRQPREIVRGVARPRGWPSWVRLCGAGLVPSASRGGGAPTGAFSIQCTPYGESPRGMRVPFLFGEGTQRPSALRTALVGIGSHSRWRRVSSLRWAWPSSGTTNRWES